MEHYKLSKSLLSIQLYQSVCDKNWIEVSDLLGGQYSANKNIGFKTPTLR